MEDSIAVATVAETPFLGEAPPNMSGLVVLNNEQEEAMAKLLDFLADPDQQFFTLRGYAGTGKTFLMQELVRRCKNTRTTFAFTAPTNKAAKVLRELTGHACTIYSLLGLRIEKNGELKELVGGEYSEDLDDIDVIVLDEASMVNSKLFHLLQDRVEDHPGLKVIYMGDPAQLPPVGEVSSPVWGLDSQAELTRVMRYDNQILKFVTNVRQVVNSPAPCINIKSDNDGHSEGVWKMTRAQFKEAVYNDACNGAFGDGALGKVIAWRNARVDEYNDLIRRAIFGAEAVPGNFLQGERIIATAPCKRGDDSLLNTDDEAIVENVIVTTHPTNPKYRAFELKCVTELGKTIRLIVLHPSSKGDFDRDCEELAHQAREKRHMWRQFWALKDIFHEVKYAYAITAHRAQGSTYENVYVDYQDILLNRNRKEAFQCLYVACSRPTKKLVLA